MLSTRSGTWSVKVTVPDVTDVVNTATRSPGASPVLTNFSAAVLVYRRSAKVLLTLSKQRAMKRGCEAGVAGTGPVPGDGDGPPSRLPAGSAALVFCDSTENIVMVCSFPESRI